MLWLYCTSELNKRNNLVNNIKVTNALNELGRSFWETGMGECNEITKLLCRYFSRISMTRIESRDVSILRYHAD